MILCVDVGNTNTNFAIFEGEDHIAQFRVTTKIPRTSDEFCVMIREMIHMNDLDIEMITGAIVSSVVPGIMYSLNSGIYKAIGVEAMQVGTGTKTGIRINLPNPREMGADRIVDAVAALELYGGPVMVIDFGTATTYDLVLADGSFITGITSPGIRISANALWNDTAKLPEIELALPETIIVKDTVSSMQAGLLYGAIGQTEYIVNRVKKEAGLTEMKVVATGGLGKIISDATEVIEVYDQMLTMKGLRIIYDKNKRR